MAALETMLRLVISGDSKGAQKALSDLEGASKKAGGALDAPSQKLGEMGQKMSGVGNKMTMGLTLPLVAMGAVAATSFAKFETSMNQVQSATGASDAELQKMSDYAKQMGADTVFSAGEAAAAMLELAKSGMTPAQIQAGGLKAAMDLAAAGQLDLADAATVTSNAMNTFGIEAKDAATVAAALAGGANASSADVSDLAQALGQVGPGAKTAGLSLQQTVAVLAEFADKGIRGSDAGTSLKTMLTRLVPSTDKAAGMMEKLGISFVNADGSMKDISEVADILQEKMGGLSDEQKTLAMNTMFGSDATRAATILMEGGAEGLEKYTKATNDQNAATDMANALMKGLGGAIEQMKGSLETAGISIGEILAPSIRVVAGGIKLLADGLGAMPGWMQKVVVGVGLLVAALGPLLVITGKVLTGFQSIRNFTFKRQIAGTAGVPGVGGGTSAGGGAAGAGAEQRNTTAVNQNTAAHQRSTAATNREATASGRAAAADTRSASASNLETAADRKSAAASTLAGTRVGALGGRAQGAAPMVQSLGSRARTTAPQVGTLGTFAGRTRGAMGKLSGAMNGPVGSIALMMAFAVALEFTIGKLGELKSAMDGALSDTGKAKDAEANALAQAQKALKDLAANPKYGKGSQQYKDMLEIIRQIKRDGIDENTSWLMKSFLRTYGDLKGIWGSIFGQATGGDYMVTSPTLFLAGEAGPERATFTPRGKAGPGGGGTVVNINIATLNGTDEQAARRLAGRVGQILRQQQLANASTGF